MGLVGHKTTQVISDIPYLNSSIAISCGELEFIFRIAHNVLDCEPWIVIIFQDFLFKICIPLKKFVIQWSREKKFWIVVWPTYTSFVWMLIKFFYVLLSLRGCEIPQVNITSRGTSKNWIFITNVWNVLACSNTY